MNGAFALIKQEKHPLILNSVRFHTGGVKENSCKENLKYSLQEFYLMLYYRHSNYQPENT
jgi:hypothetical protein